jgi:hypothetical protein
VIASALFSGSTPTARTDTGLSASTGSAKRRITSPVVGCSDTTFARKRPP